MPKIPRQDIPPGSGARVNFGRVQPNSTGRDIAEFGDELVALGKLKKDVDDTIEANELLADFAIKTRELESEVERSDIRHDEIVPTFKKGIDQLAQDVIKRARSSDVRDALATRLPTRIAEKVNQMQSVSDKRFVSESVAGYERTLQKNTRAYASADTDEERSAIRQRHVKSIEVLSRMGVLSADQRAKEELRFNRSIELFDIERVIQDDPSAGIQAIMNPKKFLEKFPNVKIEDLDNITSKSITLEERNRKLFQQRRKEARENIISFVDEAVIRGELDFEQLNEIRDRQLLDPDDYRRLAGALQARNEAGGFSDPAVRNRLGLEIRLNPGNVTNGVILEEMRQKKLSAKDAMDLLDLKKQELRRGEEDSDKRFSGPLYSAGKQKLTRIIGEPGILGNITGRNAARLSSAVDVYNDMLKKDPAMSHKEASDKVLELFKKPDIGKVMPKQFLKDPVNPQKGVDHKKILEAYRKADPATKEFLGELIDRLEAGEEPGDLFEIQ